MLPRHGVVARGWALASVTCDGAGATGAARFTQWQRSETLDCWLGPRPFVQWQRFGMGPRVKPEDDAVIG